jgi:lycopene cyclase domain-containing protein
MTYLGFLAAFLGLPLAGLSLLTWWDARRRPLSPLTVRAAALALLAHVGLAVVYTTPWDNYLVATRVWWYDPARVLGIMLGWVPLEEYTFFVLQTLVAGLLLFALARRLPPAASPAQASADTASRIRGRAHGHGSESAKASTPARSGNAGYCRVAGPVSGSAAIPLPALAGSGRLLRTGSATVLGVTWLGSVAVLALGWKPGTYLGLELAWALPPLALQLAVGADILWRHRRNAGLALALLTGYLCAADFLAIGAGVWTINPEQSLGLLLGGVLPVEEAVFFLLTNCLVMFGLTLALAPETWERWYHLVAALRRTPAPEGA